MASRARPNTTAMNYPALLRLSVALAIVPSAVQANVTVSFPTRDGGRVYADEYGSGPRDVILARIRVPALSLLSSGSYTAANSDSPNAPSACDRPDAKGWWRRRGVKGLVAHNGCVKTPKRRACPVMVSTYRVIFYRLAALKLDGDDAALRCTQAGRVEHHKRLDCFLGGDGRLAALAHSLGKCVVISVIAPLLGCNSLRARGSPQGAPKFRLFVAPTGEIVGWTQTCEDCLRLDVGAGRDITPRLAIGAKLAHRQTIEFAGRDM